MEEYFMRIKEVIKTSGLPETTLYRCIREGTFPKSVKIGAKAVAWPASQVNQWVEDRKAGKPLAPVE